MQLSIASSFTNDMSEVYVHCQDKIIHSHKVKTPTVTQSAIANTTNWVQYSFILPRGKYNLFNYQLC